MSDTTNLHLPYLAPGQAQKHVTVNESLRRLDAIVQLSVVSATTAVEPGSPADGAVYIVPSGKSGASWAGFANEALGYYRDGAWEEIAPKEGWLAWVKDADKLMAYTGSAWSLFPAGKIVTLSATDKLIGRATAGAGAAEEIALTSAGRALIDDADAAAQRATLGLGAAAIRNTGTSGANVPLLSTSNSWGTTQYFENSANHEVTVINAATPATYNADQQWWRGGSVKWLTSLRTADTTNDWGLYNAGRGAFDIRVSDSNGVVSLAQGIVSGAIRPGVDNTLTNGTASFRWSVVYAGAGTINTSDAGEKTALRPLAAGEMRAIRRAMAGVGVYQWLDALAAKGADPAQGGARLHVGVTAQDVASAFASEGLDARNYALFCADAVVETVESEPARIEPAIAPVEELRDEAGNVLRAAQPGRPAMHWPPRTLTRPLADASGKQVVRLGVRYDQLLVMALAALFAQQP